MYLCRFHLHLKEYSTGNYWLQFSRSYRLFSINWIEITIHFCSSSQCITWNYDENVANVPWIIIFLRVKISLWHYFKLRHLFPMFCDLLHIGKSFLTPSLLPFEFRKCVRTFVNQISRIREIRKGSTSKFVFTGTNNSFAFLFWQLFSSKYRYHGELMTQKRHLKVLLLTLKLIR